MAQCAAGSLECLCLRKVISAIENKQRDVTAQLQELPYQLKNSLVDILCKRGILSDESVAWLASCHLTCLNLRDCTAVTDLFLDRLTAAQVRLRSLDLREIHGRFRDISADALCTFFQQSGNQLRHLTLTRCRRVNDVVLQSIGQHCPHLTSLDLTLCNLITSKGLEMLAPLTHLRTLSIARADEINDNGALAIAKSTYAEHLEALDISHTSIADLGFSSIAERCSSLTTIKMAGCHITMGMRARWHALQSQRAIHATSEGSSARRLSMNWTVSFF
eukprot:TRINITY_DN12441_c0_g2_i1.p1 TRINITY_DN12441_c0_g2~~TRINITY_DN12441_c0_g2_i1.p1  ORF type:complete len:276 (+),score=18.70 TRINITY_DN12441_c0_g2_i1:461-1288(+)